MGFKGFALVAGQKHKSESYVFSFISSNYQSLREGFIVLRCMNEEADTVGSFSKEPSAIIVWDKTNKISSIWWCESYCVEYIIF